MNQTLLPARVSPPGRILSRELEARGWTQKDLAEIMRRPHPTINGIIRGNKRITPETAIELAEVFGTSAEFWHNLEAKYRLHVAQKEASDTLERGEISRRSRLYSFAPVAEMIRRGWIKTTDSIDELEQQICDFFDISQLEETPELSISDRQSENRNPETQAQIAWAKRVENVVREQEIPEFSRTRLKAAIPEILTYATEVEDVALVSERLLSLGVHFAIVPHLEKNYLDGAAFYVESNPVVALTLRYKRIDHFWFTLMHELGHIVAGHKGSYFDNMENLEAHQDEAEANQLAANWLLPPRALSEFIEDNTPYFSTKKVVTFAESQCRHPGILVGRLQRDELIPYKNLKKFLVRVDPYLTDQIHS